MEVPVGGQSGTIWCLLSLPLDNLMSVGHKGLDNGTRGQ